jgi:hypothetical protein
MIHPLIIFKRVEFEEKSISFPSCHEEHDDLGVRKIDDLSTLKDISGIQIVFTLKGIQFMILTRRVRIEITEFRPNMEDCVEESMV